MKLELTGAAELNKALSELYKQSERGARKGIQTICAHLKAESVKLAPLDTGDLRGSAYYSTRDTGTKVEGEVGFPLPYAAVQHERTWYNHPKGGQAKYLEQPFKEFTPMYIRMLEKALDIEKAGGQSFPGGAYK
jgi:hypothetical protein